MKDLKIGNRKKILKNPLVKRIPRELSGDWRKYLVVSMFLILTIGFVSGMYVANESMMTAVDNSVYEYRLESGHFELNREADEELLSAIASGKMANVRQYYLDAAKKEMDEKFEKEFMEAMLSAAVAQARQTEDYQTAYEEAWEKLQNGIDGKYADAEVKYGLDDPDFQAVPVEVYENFYRNEEEDNNNDGVADGTVRVYVKTEEVNLACLMEGSFPATEGEIAIDRMHADNAGIKVGDTITVGGEPFRVTGLIACVNYSTLHEKNTDLIFDAIKFDVAMVTERGFRRLNTTIHYVYAWRYAEEPADEKEEKSLSDDFLKALLTQTVVADNEIEDYLPRYANQAINFAAEDMGSDEAMGGVLLDILIVIIAFIFAVTISNTIVKESQTIGTLRASGYSRGELVRHYLSMPVIVTLIAACIGNILGYTVFKNIVVSMYYNSYSLPAYATVWNPYAFVKTTLIPAALMLVVNLVVILKMMQHTPLQFLRHDLKKTQRKKAIRLPGWKFFGRFRLRIMLQNIPNYMILFLGISFIMVMLAMAVGMPDTLKYYKDNAADMMFARYQYVLKSYEDGEGNVVGTQEGRAEKFGMRSLQKKSDTLDEDAFSGYMSDVEIMDIEEENIATVLTERDITKMCDQLDHSMGAYMQYFQYLCVLLSAVLIYLLTKIIIEKNENAISMVKILGYENREIAGLYLLSTTMFLVAADAVGAVIGALVMRQAWRAIMFDYSGWFTFVIEPAGFVKMFTFVLLGYLIVMVFDFRRIQKIRMEEALKNVE